MKKILCIVGTRPEAIKMAPIIEELKADPFFKVRVLATAQHRDMLDQVLEIFDIKPDLDLNIMRANQALSELTGRLLLALDEVLDDEQPDVVLAQGDTTTVLTAALSSFYHKIPFGHVEAGLRTGNINSPFPEEMNRVMVGRIATWHFAPTEESKRNLLREGIPIESIFVTGNSVIDALYSIVGRCTGPLVNSSDQKRLLLVTVHRRENFGIPFRGICSALLQLASKNKDLEILFPVHPNPSICEVAHEILANHDGITLCEPLGYVPFIKAMKRAHIILSDSGGVQEEAPALGKPVLVLREKTERPEAVDMGVVKLIGSDSDLIVSEVQKLLDDEALYKSMAKGVSPYGDGLAANRIVQVLKDSLTS